MGSVTSLSSVGSAASTTNGNNFDEKEIEIKIEFSENGGKSHDNLTPTSYSPASWLDSQRFLTGSC